MKAFVEPCCWLRVSRLRHDELQGMPIVDQLVLKLKSDIEGFELIRFHSVWGRPVTAITVEDIAAKGEGPPNNRIKDIRGRKFGRATAVSYDGVDSRQRSMWICICECGKAFTTRGSQLVAGHTQSCGCLQRERAAETQTTHGHCAEGSEHNLA